jgi:hypothetical protein
VPSVTPTTALADSEGLVLASTGEASGGTPFGPFGAAPILVGAVLLVGALGLVFSRSRVRVVSTAPGTGAA